MGATRLRCPAGPQAGSATAELVIATPALLLMVMLVVQFALWQHGQHVATAAAGAARARQFLAQLGPHLVVAPTVTARRDAATARVEVLGTAEPLVPWLRLPIHAVAQGPLEQFNS